MNAGAFTTLAHECGVCWLPQTYQQPILRSFAILQGLSGAVTIGAMEISIRALLEQEDFLMILMPKVLQEIATIIDPNL
jgi:hypothetical protein